MKPINIWSWDWSVLDDTGDVDCASSIKVYFSRAKDCSNRNCKKTGVKLSGSLEMINAKCEYCFFTIRDPKAHLTKNPQLHSRNFHPKILLAQFFTLKLCQLFVSALGDFYVTEDWSRTQACLNFCSRFVVAKVQTTFCSSTSKSLAMFPNKRVKLQFTQ